MKKLVGHRTANGSEAVGSRRVEGSPNEANRDSVVAERGSVAERYSVAERRSVVAHETLNEHCAVNAQNIDFVRFLRRQSRNFLVRLSRIIAGAKSENEHCSEARCAVSPSHLLSRAQSAYRALQTVSADGWSMATRRGHASHSQRTYYRVIAWVRSLAGGAFYFLPGQAGAPAGTHSGPTRRLPMSGCISTLIPVLVFILLSSLLTGSANAAILIHGVDDVMANYTRSEGEKLYFTPPSAQTWELITDVSDPDIANKGDGNFHPFHPDIVEQALAGVSFPLDIIDVEIFILPYPRREVLSSSAVPGRVFLSPGVLEYLPEQEHFAVTHELGHIVHRRFMPDDNHPLWQQYRELRRITDTSVYNNEAMHKNRPTEVFAEDFRFLFGSSLANYSGSIENRDLPLPTEVAGLREFFLSLPGGISAIALLELQTYPNPFNPLLNISFNVGVAEPVDFEMASSPATYLAAAPAQSASAGFEPRRLLLRVFDVYGRLVKTLIDGELPPGSHSAIWTGTDERGIRVSSGVYFLRLEVGEEVAIKKVVLAK